MVEDGVGASERAGPAGLDALLASRGTAAVDFAAWQKIEAAEVAAARQGAPREKIVEVAAMLAATR
jgi:ferredoxin--NADP+ reductase